MVNQIKAALTATAIALAIASCQKAETPPEVREDIAQAQAEAETETAFARAEGEHRIAMERCDALAGDERDICVDEADRALEAARDAAEGLPATSQPR